MGKLINLVGEQFGMLTVIKRAENSSTGGSQWLCICDCGKNKIVKSIYLRNGGTKSCGCLLEEIRCKNGYKNYNNRNFKKAIEEDRFKGTKISILKSKTPTINTSGCKGVSFYKKHKKWGARIGISGKMLFLGLYDNKEDAIKARKEAEEKYWEPIIKEYNEIIKS